VMEAYTVVEAEVHEECGVAMDIRLALCGGSWPRMRF